MHAITSLYRQFATERQFGWYVPDLKWREMLRGLYPVEWVAAHHRGDVAEQMLRDHAKRVRAFNNALFERS